VTIYTIDKRFTTSVERTKRVLEVAEAFGIGLSDKEFVIYDNTKVEINQGDVVYITGQSGSGKSLLLKELKRLMAADGLKVADLNDVVLEDKPVIELVGENTFKATDLLAKAGISDAYIYLRKPSELSDGQRYRLKLAKLIESGADVWVADEFGAVLDRVTAKVIAFNIQKIARQLGKTVMVATTHTDLTDELGPDVQITKLFQARVAVETGNYAAIHAVGHQMLDAIEAEDFILDQQVDTWRRMLERPFLRPVEVPAAPKPKGKAIKRKKGEAKAA
jgi:ABC-type ATPase with predicted acetyltransferase domain